MEDNHPSAKAPLEELADHIQEQAKILSDFLRSTDHPHPSFERDAPLAAIPDSSPADIIVARTKLMEAALRTFQLAMGPKEYLPNLVVGFQYIVSLRWLSHFDIFALVPLSGSIAYSKLAEQAHVSERQLKTVARMAMTNNLFSEPEQDHIAHTATSALLVTNDSLRGWTGILSEVQVPAALKLVEASEKWHGSVAKNETAYNLAFQTDLPFFEHLGTLPDRTKQFASYMKAVQTGQGSALKHLVDGFDWAALGKATVVDVGGSTGASSIALAEKFPDLNFIVQDLPENANEGRSSVATTAPSVANRIHFQAHDFFQTQPVKGAEVYLLRLILHDWPVKEALLIVKNLVAVLNKGSRLVIMDTVLPKAGALLSAQERLVRVREMTMLQLLNGLERDLNDWRAIFAAADERLALVNVVQPVGSMMSVMEVLFDM